MIRCARGGGDVEAARLVGATESLRDRLGEAAASDEASLEPTVEQLMATLGMNAYERARAEGRAMSSEAAVELALASLD